MITTCGGVEVCVAVVRIRNEALNQLRQNREKNNNNNKLFASIDEAADDDDNPGTTGNSKFFGAADFDVLMAVPPPPLLAAGPSCSSQVQIEHQALELPRCRQQHQRERAVDAAWRFVGQLNTELLTRAVPIPLSRFEDNLQLLLTNNNHNNPNHQQSQHHHTSHLGTSSFSTFPLPPAPPPVQLVLIPVTQAHAKQDRIAPGLAFCPFATVLHAAMNYDCTLVDAQSQNELLRIGEWLNQGQCRSGPHFLHSLFTSPVTPLAATKRILRCVPNPGGGSTIANNNDKQQHHNNGSTAATDANANAIVVEQQNRMSSTMEGDNDVPCHQNKENAAALDKQCCKIEAQQNNGLMMNVAEMELAANGAEMPTTTFVAGENANNHSKYECVEFVVNPLFGTNLVSKRRIAMAHEYFVKGRKQQQRRDVPKRKRWDTGGGSGGGLVQQQRSPTEFWEQQYPLHKHAFDGNAQKIRELLALGYDPNELDNDFWTPLHYCAFYNRLEACQALMLDLRMDVNVPNRTGATALHFAALNGHVYVAELILSHQFANTNIRDSTGKTPLDLCASVPKPDWQGVAFLLQQSASAIRPNKIEVQLVGGSALQVEVNDPETATAGELRAKVLELEGLEPALGEQIFAIWLVDSRLSLQLKAEQKVQVHLDKWPEHLEKFGGDEHAGAAGGTAAATAQPEQSTAQQNNTANDASGNGKDRVRVVLKRDARTLLRDEQTLARKSPVAVSLLYGEAEQQFLRGMYPSHEKHFLPMAAIIAHRLYGTEWPSSVDVQMLCRVLPRHLVPNASDLRAFASLVSKLRQAHRQLAGLNLVQLQLRFLNLCWSLNVYGCTFFRAYMLMSKPLRGTLQVHVGLNDWGMCVLNAASHRQVVAIGMDKLEVRFTANTHFLEVNNRKRDFVATITTPQAQLINNLLKQLRLKVETTKTGAAAAKP